MTRGELQSEPLLVVLSRIAQEHASGALHLARTGLVSEEGQVYVRSGQVYAATAGRERFPIGARMVTAYGLAPEALDAALRAQTEHLQGWRLGEILVHLGHVQPETVEEASREQLLDALTTMSGWGQGSWRFRIDERTRTMVGVALPWAEVSALVDARAQEWQSLLPIVHGAHAVPQVVAVAVGAEYGMEYGREYGRENGPEVAADPVTRALLGRIDGVRTLAEIAHDRGLSVLEAGRALARLTVSGAVWIGQSRAGGSALAMLDALSQVDPTAVIDDVVAPVVDLSAAREARAADEAARVQARREADDVELAEAARRSAEAQAAAEAERAETEAMNAALAAARAQAEAALREAERIEAERVEAERVEVEQRAAEQARVDAERAAAVAAANAAAEQAAQDERSRARRAEVLEAERRAQRAAEAEADDVELSLADQLRTAAGVVGGDTSDLAAALAAALELPPEPVIALPPVDSPVTVAPEPIEAPEPYEEPAPVPTGLGAFGTPDRPMVRSGHADMASLFRELSSLGTDDEPPPPPPRAAPPRPPGAADPKAKKKKGLFGR